MGLALLLRGLRGHLRVKRAQAERAEAWLVGHPEPGRLAAEIADLKKFDSAVVE